MQLILLALALILSASQQSAHTDKQCRVTEVVTEGVRSRCGEWKPTKDDKLYMPAEVTKKLRVGGTFYFVWRETRWVAEIRSERNHAAAQERVIVNCTYDDQKSVAVCEMPAGTRIIPIDWASETFSEWLWQTQKRGSESDDNLPLVKVKPAHGAVLKAELQDDNEWAALAACEVRVHRRVNEYSKQHHGDRVPFTLREMPGDCQR